jgi:tripartite-type tricarboxylate transporter receptor subunit TctC
MFAPIATPKPVIERLHSTLVKHLSEPSTKEKFEAQGCDLVASTPEALGARVRSDQAKWSKIVREKNISVE